MDTSLEHPADWLNELTPEEHRALRSPAVGFNLTNIAEDDGIDPLVLRAAHELGSPDVEITFPVMLDVLGEDGEEHLEEVTVMRTVPADHLVRWAEALVRVLSKRYRGGNHGEA